MQPYADAPESRSWRAPVVPARRDGEMPSVGINPRPPKRTDRKKRS
ncbi:hypothetical protein J2S42_006229 [Catenuloplanes indicus]|uniref:Uncharacterized protein n=1 Tax=Catenuloplanes indicus TaxID=137267 RepID=A0AAE3W5A5_9ACTN|nr:hypothetical protein [Catenuloplanes indicus]